MKKLRNYLDILFRQILPEVLIQNMQHLNAGETPPYLKPVGREISWEFINEGETQLYLKLSSREISCECFRHFAQLNFQGYSFDELENFYYDMQSYIDGSRKPGERGLYYLLPQYMEKIMEQRGDTPCCKYREMLNWRSLSLRLGQDLPLMSYLAYEDCQKGRKRKFFAWNHIIGSNNTRLRRMLEQGMAENHFHLNGSTQSFLLSWLCMMNHPGKIAEYFQKKEIQFRMVENLNGGFSYGKIDNQMSWIGKLYIACYIRCKLYERVNGADNKLKRSDIIRFIGLPDVGKLEREIDGRRFVAAHGRDVNVADYAVQWDEEEWKEYEHNRLLAGERRFLYQCFYECYNGELNAVEQDMLYLYLLIKTRFRSELIQVNQKVGFHNFACYQDRKNDFFRGMKEYEAEAYRLAINTVLKNQPVRSLEARITPGKTKTEQIRSIFEIDRIVALAEQNSSQKAGEVMEKAVDNAYFFVIHFPKEKLTRMEENAAFGIVGKPRNFITRQKTERGAKAMAAALQSSPYYAQRVYGIDACSTEIGCRPETFATDFRFLRGLSGAETGDGFIEKKQKIHKLWLTYHVGEDFLDLVDGLRAIDEAVTFLDMRNGDRLGHALALGVDPEGYYASKEKGITISKQDLLDNYVWILFRSLEFGVTMDSELRSWMQYEAQKLLYQIYPMKENDSYLLKEYFDSWKLRGDDPGLYCMGEYREWDHVWGNDYEHSRIQSASDLNILRRQYKIAHLYYRYHFGRKERVEGQKIEIVEIPKGYVRLVEDLQQCMMQKILERGIEIECNPSSNVLIGTFRRYDQHPILRFNRYALCNEEKEKSAVQLNVSINTDDLGVFDTSLECEYELMACALEKMEDEDGNKLYSQDAIYDYLDHIRQMGISQVFRGK